MGKRSQVKGKSFEKLVANLIGSSLNEWLLRNPSQYGGDAGRDLLTRLPFCIQCQHAKKIDPWGKLREAQGSAVPGEVPVAILRRDRKAIIAVMEINDWLELVRAALNNG